MGSTAMMIESAHKTHCITYIRSGGLCSIQKASYSNSSWFGNFSISTLSSSVFRNRSLSNKFFWDKWSDHSLSISFLLSWIISPALTAEQDSDHFAKWLQLTA